MSDYTEFYKKKSGVYNQSRLDDEENRTATLDIIKHYVSPGASILDIGCGTGVYGAELSKIGYLVQGIDKSLSQVSIAKNLISAQVGDVQNIPFEDNTFDACCMIMMIHQLSREERKKAFFEISRVLKKGGVLIIKTASWEDLKSRIISDFFPKTLEIDYQRYPKEEILLDELSNCFENIRIQKIQLVIPTDKESLLKKISLQGASNLGMLSEEEINNGVLAIKEKYVHDDIILRKSHNSFYIATVKDDN